MRPDRKTIQHRGSLFCMGLFLLIFILPGESYSQAGKVNIPAQRLLLQLGSGYLNVARQNQIDMDSGLALSARRSHLSRMIVIGEGYDDIFLNPSTNKWLQNEDIRSAKTMLSSTSGTRHTQLLSLIGSYYVFQSSAKKNDLDSALLYLTEAKQEAETNGNVRSVCQALISLGKCYLEKGDISLAGTTYTEAISKSAKSGDKQGEAMAWASWGTYSPFVMNTIGERINQIRKAYRLYELLNDKENQVVTLTNIGYLSFAAGNLKESKESFFKALAIEKSIGFTFTHYTTGMISVVSAVMGDHESHLKYSMEAVQTADATKDSIALAYLYANRSVADLLGSSSIAEGLELGMRSLAEFKKNGGDPAMYTLANNLAEYLISLGRSKEAVPLIRELINKYPPVSPLDRQDALLCLAYAYIKINPVEAEKYYLEAENLEKETVAIRGTLGSFRVYYRIGLFYFEERQYEKSRQYLNKALTFSNKTEDGNSLSKIEKCFAVMDSASGNFEKAYSHLSHYSALNDSLTMKSASRMVSELRVQYDAKKKEDDIKMLNQQASLQETQIRQERLTRNLMIIGAALLLLLLGLLYNRYRLKQRTNLQLESQQKEITQKNASLQHLVEEKEWLLKEVHHRVKNNLHTVICLLESQAAYLENDALKAIENSQHRIYAMSLIHQKLYQSEDVKTIDMSVYLPEFIQYLKDSFGMGGRIAFQLKIEPLQLNVSQAIPIALIVNEAVSNSMKYAFQGKSNGFIEISMYRHGQQIRLEIYDNGIGIDTSTMTLAADSLGLKLMKGLSEDISGSIHFENRNGTMISVAFTLDPLNNLHLIS